MTRKQAYAHIPDLDQVGGKIASRDHLKETQWGVGETCLALNLLVKLALTDTPEDHLAKNRFIWLLDQLLYCCHHHLLYENNLKKSDVSWVGLFRSRFGKGCHEFHAALGGHGQLHDQGVQAARQVWIRWREKPNKTHAYVTKQERRHFLACRTPPLVNWRER